MFTGIVTDLGTVAAVTNTVAGARDCRFRIQTSYDMSTVDDGASIACNGCCLTVVGKGAGWFDVDVSEETLSKTTLASWRVGARINLERSLRLGDELGGHLVSGHVDGLATVAAIRPDGASVRYDIGLPGSLGRFVAAKGSVALDGVSLTVNDVIDQADGSVVFGVNIIPHTQSVTTFGALKAGDPLNMEIDLMARYVARLLPAQTASKAS
jgi:riboflavin synthase